MTFQDPSDAMREQRRRNAVAIGIRVAFFLSLLYLITLLVRLPVENAADAATRYQGQRQDIARLHDSLRSLQSGGGSQLDAEGTRAYERLVQGAAVSCPQAPAQSSLTATITPLLGTGGGAVQGRLIDAAREELRKFDAGALACLKSELARSVDNARQRRWAAIFLIAVLAATGAAVVYLRRRDAAALREQLRFNRQLIDAIPLPLSMRSPHGTFLLVNKAFERRFGLGREQLVSNPVGRHLKPEYAERIRMMDERAAATSDPVDENFQISDDMGERHVQVRVQAVRREDGALVGSIGVQTDVTALHRKEVELTQANAKLSQLSIKMIGAQEDERRRIARDLHDQVGQILTALKMQLSSLARRERIDSPAADFALPIDLAEEALRHARDLSASLHPHLLDDLGIEAALRSLVDRFIRPSLAQVDLRCHLQPLRGPAAIELVAFRVVQEALTNVVRHARATRVGVILEACAGELSIEVMDDGAGFDAGPSGFELHRATSVGMASMRDRVIEAGGQLRIDSAPGAGTSVRARMPWAVQVVEKEHANTSGG